MSAVKYTCQVNWKCDNKTDDDNSKIINVNRCSGCDLLGIEELVTITREGE
jgi:hypothetical protein